MNKKTATALIDALDAAGGIVAAVGAGGKKSTLYRLLEAHRAIGTKRIAFTSTVQIAPAGRGDDIETLILDDRPFEPAIAQTRSLDGAWLIAGPSQKPGRLSGLPEEAIQHIHEAGAFDVSLTKADGARMRMIKAPREDEPALPDHVATVLPIVSARVFGRPLTDKLVHRPERLTDVIGAERGMLLSADHVACLLSSPEGGLKGTGKASVVPIINMVDSPERLAAARAAAEKALAMTGRFERVVLASMTRPMPLVEVIEA